LSAASIAPALLLLPGIDGTGKFLGEFAKALRPSVEPIVVPYPSDRALGYDGLRGARLAEIDGPHLLLQSRPAECAAAVLEFIREVVASAPTAQPIQEPV
jgi:hypothetical protein